MLCPRYCANKVCFNPKTEACCRIVLWPIKLILILSSIIFAGFWRDVFPQTSSTKIQHTEKCIRHKSSFKQRKEVYQQNPYSAFLLWLSSKIKLKCFWAHFHVEFNVAAFPLSVEKTFHEIFSGIFIQYLQPLTKKAQTKKVKTP